MFQNLFFFAAVGLYFIGLRGTIANGSTVVAFGLFCISALRILSLRPLPRSFAFFSTGLFVSPDSLTQTEKKLGGMSKHGTCLVTSSRITNSPSLRLLQSLLPFGILFGLDLPSWSLGITRAGLRFAFSAFLFGFSTRMTVPFLVIPRGAWRWFGFLSAISANPTNNVL